VLSACSESGGTGTVKEALEIGNIDAAGNPPPKDSGRK